MLVLVYFYLEQGSEINRVQEIKISTFKTVSAGSSPQRVLLHGGSRKYFPRMFSVVDARGFTSHNPQRQALLVQISH